MPRPSSALRLIGHRARQIGVLAVITGAATGLVVAGFERVVNDGLLAALLRAPLWVQAIGPMIGLAVAALALRWLTRGASPSTADEYIRSFHDNDHRLDLRPVPGRIVASIATLGAGAPLGFEGPSIYMGAAIGTWLQHRFSRYFNRTDTKVLLVCGAAAGVAAIFKAPATGMVFALEVPYREDLARRMLLPAMFSAATSYVVFAALNGTSPLLPVAGTPPFDLRDLLGAAALGLACGGGAHLFSRGLLASKDLASRMSAWIRVPLAGLAIALLFVAGRALTGESVVIGPGYSTIAWALEPNHAFGAIVALFVVRGLATMFAVSGGGAGGLFVPLVVQGALVGSAVSSLVHASPASASLFPLLGVAAFLGAGYRVPLAAVVFVAESTGRPGFVVPGLIAAASSQLLMGRWSVSPYQQDARKPMLEHRLQLPVSSALRTDAATVPPDATIEELFGHHIAELRLRMVPVVDGAAFCGIVTIEDVASLPRADWDTTTVADVMRTEVASGELQWTLRHAVTAMEEADTDRLVILDGDAFVGVVTTGEILKLDAILERAEEPDFAGPS
ncbi:MAG TPA: chloride channel protein [Acidimicrobiales bacterium]